MITFDCYGTLIDWERGLARRLRGGGGGERAPGGRGGRDAPLRGDGARGAGGGLPELSRRPRRDRPARGGAPGLAAARRARGLPAPRASSAGRPSPTPMPPCAAWRGAGYQLGILSNVDNDLLAWTRRHFAAPFELVVTAEQVRSYKPAPGHFLEARARIGRPPWLARRPELFPRRDPLPGPGHSRAPGSTAEPGARRRRAAGPRVPDAHRAGRVAGSRARARLTVEGPARIRSQPSSRPHEYRRRHHGRAGSSATVERRQGRSREPPGVHPRHGGARRHRAAGRPDARCPRASGPRRRSPRPSRPPSAAAAAR